MHHLDIDIKNDNLNPRIFNIEDTSVYDKNLPIDDLILEIYPPSSSKPLVLMVEKGFKVVVNSNLLHLTKGKILGNLPDGLYHVTISVKPGAKTKKTYYYFRNTKQINNYLDVLTSLIEDRKNITNIVYTEKKKKLLWYKQLIDGAKFLAEDKHDKKAAFEVYQEVDELLQKFSECVKC